MEQPKYLGGRCIVVDTSYDAIGLETYYTSAANEAMEWTKQVPPLRLADLIEEIAAYLLKHVHFINPDIALVVAVWIIQTYCYDQFYYCGYIAVRSDLPGSGKTVLLETIGALSNGNPSPIVAPTEAVLFRSGNQVWLIDEVDNLRDQDKEIHGRIMAVLNSGFKKTGTVPRIVRNGDDFTVTPFSTYGPKAFAGLRKLASTISDRCFHIHMKKRPAKMPRMTVKWMQETAVRVQTEVKAWIDSQAANMAQLYAWLSEIGGLPRLQRYDTRFQDIAEPLFVLAVIADAEYATGPRITKALLRGLPLLVGERKAEGEQLIRAIQDLEDLVFTRQEEGALFIPSQELLERVRAIGCWWVDSTKDLAIMLRTVNLSSRSNGTAHGYDLTREWFKGLEESIRQGVNPAPAAGF